MSHGGGDEWPIQWTVSDPKAVRRCDLESVWKSGKLTGLFNLSTREQFEACKDFAIEGETGSREATTALQERVAKLSEENLMLAERLKHVSSSKAKVAPQKPPSRKEDKEKIHLRERIAELEEIEKELREDLKSVRETVRDLFEEKTRIERELSGERAKRERLEAMGWRGMLVEHQVERERLLKGLLEIDMRSPSSASTTQSSDAAAPSAATSSTWEAEDADRR